ncbi:MAG: SH3 domain-containing protein [Actinomycetota bacterium]
MFYEIFKFIVGFFLAILLLAGASVAAALYFAATLTAPPEKPTFPNDRSASQTASTKVKSASTTDASSTPSPSPSPEKLAPGTYQAIVTQPIGLILRDSPNRDSNRIGGLAYKEKVVVLEDTPDKEWQRVRSQDGDRREGWVKGGNTERVEGEQ